MKEVIDRKTYNTDTSTLMKSVVLSEDLGEGYTRYKTMQLWYSNRSEEWFLTVNKTTVDRCCMVIDVCEYINPVDEEFVYNFRKKVEDVI